MLMNAIWGAVSQLYGEYGASQTGLALIEFNPQKNQAIIRCSLKALEIVKASLASIIKVDDKRAAVHVLTVSGTLKCIRRKLAK